MQENPPVFPELEHQIRLSLESDRLQGEIAQLKQQILALTTKKALIDAELLKIEQENASLVDASSPEFTYSGMEFSVRRGSTVVEVQDGLDTSVLPEKYLNAPTPRTVNKNFVKGLPSEVLENDLGELANSIKVITKPPRLVFKMEGK